MQEDLITSYNPNSIAIATLAYFCSVLFFVSPLILILFVNSNTIMSFLPLKTL
ncbi:hypothetical protein MTR67_036069 [Solanum verrucosum]|uniref:Uncharacterized protein n=1 Tax=Solanum verrucosum TaxID=315347 RepID=A0AAF0UBC9_SOLVR|nr:hypothetical protein MTR67_036069 [Solanum verrucosum]